MSAPNPTPFALSLSKGQAELVEATFDFASAQHWASTSLSPNGVFVFEVML